MGRLMSMTVAAAVSLTSCSTPAAESVPVLPWAAEAEAVVSLLETAYDAAARLVTEQLHLDVHRCFNAARRVDLDRRQATAVLTALRLVGIHSFVV